MPKEFFGADFPFLPRREILSYEEVYRLARIFHRLGVRKVRITGGEPLLRRDLPEIVRMMASLPDTDLALTTNGALLAARASALAAAGLRRVTVSLDSIDDDVFARMNDVDFPLQRVLEGIDAAAAAGLAPIKINAVVRRGVNDGAVVALARHFRGTGHIVRFIEFMDVGTTNGWRLEEVVPGSEIVARIAAEFAVEPVAADYPGEVARRWRYQDGGGEFGVITSVSQPFCGACTRARLSTDGKLFTCLFAEEGADLRAPLRSGCSDEGLEALIRDVWAGRRDRYSEIRSAATTGGKRVEMSYIGG
jgi:cyclic pyranopterin phosphate synthase